MSLKILGVDMSAVFRRHWEATAGKEIEEPFHRSVAEIVRAREGFDRVALMLDGGTSFRTGIDPGYKANRERPPASYGEQLRRTIDRIVADGAVAFAAPEVGLAAIGGPATGLYAESDDGLATLAEWCIRGGHALRIYGGDKDLLQLVNDKHSVEVWRPAPCKPDGLWTEETVRTSLTKDGKGQGVGVHPPPLVADVLALGGDGTDGFKPFAGWTDPPEKEGGEPVKRPGIGMLTAVQLINKYGTISGVLDSLGGSDPPKGHIGEVLRRGGTDAMLKGLLLATLRRDLLIDFAPLLANPVSKPIAEPRPKAQEKPRVEPPHPSVALAVAKQATAPISRIDPYAIQPTHFGELRELAEELFNSRVYAQFPNSSAVLACILEAHERGITAGAALRNAYVVNGRLGYGAGYIAGLVMRSGEVEYYRLVETTWERAVVRFKRHGEEPVDYVATIEDARKKGFQGGKHPVWMSDAKSMLAWMAWRECSRLHFPAICANTYTPDEIRGHETEADFLEVEAT